MQRAGDMVQIPWSENTPASVDVLGDSLDVLQDVSAFLTLLQRRSADVRLAGRALGLEALHPPLGARNPISRIKTPLRGRVQLCFFNQQPQDPPQPQRSADQNSWMLFQGLSWMSSTAASHSEDRRTRVHTWFLLRIPGNTENAKMSLNMFYCCLAKTCSILYVTSGRSSYRLRTSDEPQCDVQMMYLLREEGE